MKLGGEGGTRGKLDMSREVPMAWGGWRDMHEGRREQGLRWAQVVESRVVDRREDGQARTQTQNHGMATAFVYWRGRRH